MSKEKQIEERYEISEIIANSFDHNGEKWDASDFEWSAHCVQVAGYRKASDVAREIFEEIEEALILSKCYGDSGVYFEQDIETDISELKKKYTKE